MLKSPGFKYAWLAQAFFILVNTSVGSAQQKALPLPPSYVLVMGDDQSIFVPAFLFNDDTKCDLRGDVYFGLTDGSYSPKLVLRVSADGRDSEPFPFPKDIDKDASWHFATSPGGDVYAIASIFKNEGKNVLITDILIKFSNNGDELSRRTLQFPTGFLVDSFAVQSDGHIMIVGFSPIPAQDQPEKGKNEDGPTEGKLLTILLDQSGNSVLLNGAKRFSFYEGVPESVAAGKAGSFLTAQNSTLNIYGITGELQHSYTFAKPYPDSRVRKLQYLDGKIALDLSRIIPGKAESLDPQHPELKVGPLEETWLLMNAEDGSMQGFYSLPKDFVGGSLCYVGSREFLNIRVQHGRPVFVMGRMP